MSKKSDLCTKAFLSLMGSFVVTATALTAAQGDGYVLDTSTNTFFLVSDANQNNTNYDYSGSTLVDSSAQQYYTQDPYSTQISYAPNSYQNYDNTQVSTNQIPTWNMNSYTADATSDRGGAEMQGQYSTMPNQSSNTMKESRSEDRNDSGKGYYSDSNMKYDTKGRYSRASDEDNNDGRSEYTQGRDRRMNDMQRQNSQQMQNPQQMQQTQQGQPYQPMRGQPQAELQSPSQYQTQPYTQQTSDRSGCGSFQSPRR